MFGSMTDERTGYPVISFLKHFWLLVQDVPRGTTLLSHHYGDSFLHLPSVEASAGTPCSYTSPQNAREMFDAHSAVLF